MKRSLKLRILAGIVLLLGVMAAVVFYASPYALVVEPVADIEAIWAIEDARSESETAYCELFAGRVSGRLCDDAAV